MDDIAFDRLTKLLGATPNRRNVVVLAASAAIGSFAELLQPHESDARSKKGKKKGCPKKPCPRGYQRNKRSCNCECAHPMQRRHGVRHQIVQLSVPSRHARVPRRMRRQRPVLPRRPTLP
jgi:hypothetical protein